MASGEYKGWALPDFRVEVAGEIKYYYIAKLLLEGKIIKLGKEKGKNILADLKIDTRIISLNNKNERKVA